MVKNCPEDTESLLLSSTSNPNEKNIGFRNRRRLHRRCPRMVQTFVIFSVFIVGVFLLIYIPIFSNSNSRMYPLQSWSFNTSRNTADYILPNQETALIEPKNVCDTKKFFLLIMVSSALGNFEARQNIRETGET
uniref:Hexosyltransferase n=1 Tax=Megaselia scalaris TaxID=36166 RepID=T1GUS9_MEGSC